MGRSLGYKDLAAGGQVSAQYLIIDMPKGHRGRHQSTSKEGRATIKFLEGLSGVKGVILGKTTGRKGIAGASAGWLRLQREDQAGFKAVLQASYGLQEIFIIVSEHQKRFVRTAIEQRFPRF